MAFCYCYRSLSLFSFGMLRLGFGCGLDLCLPMRDSCGFSWLVGFMSLGHRDKAVRNGIWGSEATRQIEGRWANLGLCWACLGHLYTNELALFRILWNTGYKFNLSSIFA